MLLYKTVAHFLLTKQTMIIFVATTTTTTTQQPQRLNSIFCVQCKHEYPLQLQRYGNAIKHILILKGHKVLQQS